MLIPITNICQHGSIQIGYLSVSVYLVEILGPTKRHLALIVSLMFAVGYASISLFAWLLPEWTWFSLCMTCISFPYIEGLSFYYKKSKFFKALKEVNAL